MGHKVGWLTLYAGVAGGADIILLPEIPYDVDKVVDAIHKRTKEGKGFTILAVAEGAISKEDAALSKRNTRRSLQRANTRQYHTRLQTASAKDSVLRSEWQCRTYTARRQPMPLRQSTLYTSWLSSSKGHHG